MAAFLPLLVVVMTTTLLFTLVICASIAATVNLSSGSEADDINNNKIVNNYNVPQSGQVFPGQQTTLPRFNVEGQAKSSPQGKMMKRH